MKKFIGIFFCFIFVVILPLSVCGDDLEAKKEEINEKIEILGYRNYGLDISKEEELNQILFEINMTIEQYMDLLEEREELLKEWQEKLLKREETLKKEEAEAQEKTKSNKVLPAAISSPEKGGTEEKKETKAADIEEIEISGKGHLNITPSFNAVQIGTTNKKIATAKVRKDGTITIKAKKAGSTVIAYYGTDGAEKAYKVTVTDSTKK